MSGIGAGDRYHHGDLRNALVRAAAELIREGGSLDFTLAEASRRAGVSNAAPYRHFRDRDDLLRAVGDLGFLELTRRAQHAAANHSRGSAGRIIELGKTYIQFVTEHLAFYDLMWGDKSRQEFATEEAKQASGFFVLVDAVEAWCEEHTLEHQDALVLAVKIWGMAHGLAGLSMNRNIERFLADVDVYGLYESSVKTFLEGLLHSRTEDQAPSPPPSPSGKSRPGRSIS
jgi:AcrR family transcriptional regulator